MQQFNLKKWLESQSKSEVLEFLVKWNNFDKNPNYQEIKNEWTKEQLIQCILIDNELARVK